jgi:hypothetical protein
VLKVKASSTPVAIVMNRIARHLLGGVERRGHVEAVFPGETIFYIGDNRRTVDRVNTGTPAALSGVQTKELARLAAFCAALNPAKGRQAVR